MPFLMAWKDAEWLVETKWRRNNVNSISYCIVARMFAKEYPNDLQVFNSAILRQELHLLQFLHLNYLAVILKFLWVAKWDESLKDECYWHCLMYLKLCNSYLCLLSQKFVRQSLMILCPNIKKFRNLLTHLILSQLGLHPFLVVGSLPLTQQTAQR